MIKILTLIIFFSLIIPFSSIVFAESSNSVEINNTVNTNSNSSNNETNSNTYIKVETNGEITEYNSNESNKKIEVNTINEESTIKIDGEIVNTKPDKQANPTPTSAKASEKDNPQSKEEILKENKIQIYLEGKFSFFEKMFSFFDSLQK